MSARSWNHNTHYHRLVLEAVPAHCRRALDVGCGEGMLARRLAPLCDDVLAIDLDAEVVGRAIAASGGAARIAFRKANVMTDELGELRFDLITAVATLHHLPLVPALERLRALLKPGGVLAIVGLYRARTIADYAWAAVAFPASRLLKLLYGYAEVGAPTMEPRETLQEIRTACAAILPGAVLRRRLLFRFSLIWRKPDGTS